MSVPCSIGNNEIYSDAGRIAERDVAHNYAPVKGFAVLLAIAICSEYPPS